jgi:hypothetical protein
MFLFSSTKKQILLIFKNHTFSIIWTSHIF